MHIDLKLELKKIILTSKHLASTYNQVYPNSKYSLDLIIDEIIYFLKSGVSWANLRSTINYKTLYWHYNRFVSNNIFLRLFNKIKNEYINRYIINTTTLLIDSTVIHNKNGVSKIGRNKFYKNKRITKISLMTDINGFPLSIFFLKGNYHDNTVFHKHIKDATILLPNITKKVLADKAYSSKLNYDLLDKSNITHIIPPRSNMKIAKTYKYNKNEYTKRIKIENIFSRLKVYKRINLRYDKYIKSFSGFVLLAFSIIGISIINRL